MFRPFLIGTTRESLYILSFGACKNDENNDALAYFRTWHPRIVENQFI